MAEVVQETQQEFWRPPAASAAAEAVTALPTIVTACPNCHSEFMFGSLFCHACGTARPGKTAVSVLPVGEARNLFMTKLAGMKEILADFTFPAWLQYLHFHEIKRWVGLPTASLIAFIIGLGCVTGAVGISLFYRASNLAEFQAIQMWRIEWLLAATASFVAGILLKSPSKNDPE
jgi:hypothetical protein